MTRPAGWRKPWGLPITPDQLRMKIRRMAGEPPRYRPKSGTEKSTKFRIHDVCLLAKVDKRGVYYFLAGRRAVMSKAGSPCGQDALRRINDIIDQIRGGYITKSQVGVYHFHDTPAVAPMREMRVDLGKGTITGQVIMPPSPKKMPDFGKLFGG